MISDHINQELLTLKEKKNYRSLPPLIHDGRNVILNGQRKHSCLPLLLPDCLQAILPIIKNWNNNWQPCSEQKAHLYSIVVIMPIQGFFLPSAMLRH